MALLRHRVLSRSWLLWIDMGAVVPWMVLMTSGEDEMRWIVTDINQLDYSVSIESTSELFETPISAIYSRSLPRQARRAYRMQATSKV
ncbi:hypothetical protein IWZ00DRAFT_25519 [Phyllosticta capitalensis]